MKNLSLLLLLSIIIISCSSPLDKAYKQDTLEEDIVALKESISEEELNTLAEYIALKTLSGDDMLGKNYNDLLNEAKNMQEEIRIQEEEEKKLVKKQHELDSIRIIEEYQVLSKRDNPQVIDFLERFYSPFDSLYNLSTFKYLIHPNATYSEDRMKLSKEEDRDFMRYLGVKSIEKTSQSIEVLVYVAYHLYETGSFYNIERLKLVDVGNNLKMKEWNDIGLYKMTISQYDGLENYNEIDVYNRIKSDFYLKNNQGDTLFRSWYENDKISSESRYNSKKLNGLCKKWYENGDLWYEYNFSNGKLDGLFKKWYPNGELCIKTNYKNGKMHGLQKQWYSNGQLKIEYNYIDDKKHGLQKYWKENGEIGGELIYKNGEYITHVN